MLRIRFMDKSTLINVCLLKSNANCFLCPLLFKQCKIEDDGIIYIHFIVILFIILSYLFLVKNGANECVRSPTNAQKSRVVGILVHCIKITRFFTFSQANLYHKFFLFSRIFGLQIYRSAVV